MFGCISENVVKNIFSYLVVWLKMLFSYKFFTRQFNPRQQTPAIKSHNHQNTTTTTTKIKITQRERSVGRRQDRAEARSKVRSADWSSRDRLVRAINADWSLGFAGDRQTGLELGGLFSLSLGNSFEVKAYFFGLIEIDFRKILFSRPTNHPHFQKSISGSDFHPKQTHP